MVSVLCVCMRIWMGVCGCTGCECVCVLMKYVEQLRWIRATTRTVWNEKKKETCNELDAGIDAFFKGLHKIWYIENSERLIKSY